MYTWFFPMIILLSIYTSHLISISCIVIRCTYTPTNYSILDLNLNYIILLTYNIHIHSHRHNNNKFQVFTHQHYFHYSHSYCTYTSIMPEIKTKNSINIRTMHKLLKAKRPKQNTYLTKYVYFTYKNLNG